MDTGDWVWMSARRPLSMALPVVRVVVGGAGRLDDERAEQAVAPRRDAVHMVVEVAGADLRIRVPAIVHELGADDLAGRVRPVERRVKLQRVAGDRHDLARLEPVRGVEPDTHQRSRLERAGRGGGAGEPGPRWRRPGPAVTSARPASVYGRTVCS